MVSEAPPFWWTKADWRAWSLSPVSYLYGRVAGRRMARKDRPSVSVPVLCVGNFTVGGAGKTPTALAVAKAAINKGLTPGFLSRGYGGSLDVTTLVDLHHHRADAVGDEPLLLAREAKTVISRRRFEGAERLVAEGCNFIIMDDGFQSARLTIDFALVVVDSVRGIGNGHLVPGGPVRAPLDLQLRQMSSMLKVGNGPAADALVRRAARAGRPVQVANLVPMEIPILKENGSSPLRALQIRQSSTGQCQLWARNRLRRAPSPITIILLRMRSGSVGGCAKARPATGDDGEGPRPSDRTSWCSRRTSAATDRRRCGDGVRRSARASEDDRSGNPQLPQSVA